MPVNGDAVVFPANAADVTANLNQSAVTLLSLTISSAYTGKIGSAIAYLQIGATTVNIGTPSNSGLPGNGSGRIMLNFGSVQMTTTVFSTASNGIDSGLEPVRILGTHASNKLYVLGGRVGVATTLTSEVSTLSEWDVTGSSTLNLGAGCTLTTGNQSGGTANVNSAMMTITNTAGTLTTAGTGTITTLNLSGSANLNSTGTITTLNGYGTGVADFSGNPASRTVTNLNRYRGFTYVRFPGNPAHLTITTDTRIGAGRETLS